GSATPPPPPDARTLLQSCARETHDGATVWSCGEAFLVMDAPLPGPITDDAVAGNLGGFEAELVGEGAQKANVLSRDRDAKSTRLHLELPEKGRFFAMMVIVREPKPRAISCSAKETESSRCEQIVEALVREQR
ncbi:MAG: hypothetical protein ACXWUG_27190, partial [Polyangiales bacterium]